MGLREEVASSYLALVNSGNVRYITHPADAAGVAIADDAAWDQIIASTVETNIHWLCALNVVLSANPTATLEEMIEEGTGGTDGAAVAAATTLLAIPLSLFYTAGATAALASLGGLHQPICWLPFPIRVAASTRHAARIASSPTGGVAVAAHIVVARAVGT